MSADSVLPSRPESSSTARSTGYSKAAMALMTCTAAVIPLAACSSGPSGPPAVSPATRKACAQVQAVLADGPDPGTDKVSYAEGQILPLRQIRAASPALRAAISGLADAYDRFFASNGESAAATSAVASAAARV